MATLDQVETFTKAELSGTYTDDFVRGDILSVLNSDLSGGFVREIIGNVSNKKLNEKLFKKKNLSYTDRIRFASGSVLPGRSSIVFTQVFTADEKFFDSFVPSAVDLSETNGVKFPFIGDSGALDSSPEHNIPGQGTNAISIFLSDKENPIGTSVATPSEVVDFKWTNAKWPFRSKYRNLERIFTPSTILPRNVEQTRNLRADPVSPPSSSNILGSIYYMADERMELNYPEIAVGVSSSSGMRLVPVPVPPTGLAQDATVSAIDLTVAPDPNTGDKTPVYLAGGAGSYLVKNSDGLGVKWENITPPRSEIFFGSFIRDIGHSVDTTEPDPWAAWVLVTDDGIFVNSTSKDPDRNTFWFDTGVSTFRLRSIAFNDPIGNNADANFVVVGDDGNVFTSSNRLGDSWEQLSIPGLPNNNDLNDVAFTENGNNFIIGGDGTIWTSDDRFGSNWTERFSNADLRFRAIGSRVAGAPNTDTIIAVGEDISGFFASGIIYRSTDNGLNWTDVTPADVDTMRFLSVSPGRIEDDIDWIVVGQTPIVTNDESTIAGLIRISRDDGVTWQDAAEADIELLPAGSPGGALDIAAVAVDPENNNLISGPQYVLARGSSAGDETRNVLFRPVDIVSNAFFTGSNGDLLNEAATLRRKSVKIGRNLDFRFTPTRFDELFRVYYGIGDGADLDLSEFGPSTLFGSPASNRYMRNRAPGFIDFTLNPDSFDLTIEAIRTHGARIRGWGYGIFNALPTASKIIWRRNKFGQFRDMLEQRPVSKFLIKQGGRFSTSDPAVRIEFVSGTLAHSRSIDYITNTNPPYNPTDSGQFDFEYKAGQPFFDNIDLTQFR